MSILKGIEAGADIVDTAMSPLALGTSHRPTESLVAALQGTDDDTGLDLNQLNVVRAYFAKLREKDIANGQINPKSRDARRPQRKKPPPSRRANAKKQTKNNHNRELLSLIHIFADKLKIL